MGVSNVIFISIILILLGGCKEKSMVIPIQMEKDLSTIEDKNINALKSKKIFFGHASVGYNIVNGIEDVKATNKRFVEINIRELKDSDEVVAPGIYHSVNGENGFPKSKIDGFKNFLEEKGLGNKLDIAFFKFCYVDFDRDSNVKEIFDYYSKSIDELKKEFPKLKILHVTTPLYAHAWGVKGFIRNLIKGDVSNIKRNEFNKLMISKYKDIDPIYDLAKIESTLQDGSRVTFRYKGDLYFSLAKQYSMDGGHLNEFGRYYAAKDLLYILSETSNK
jgi:hypothetical protein